MKALVLAGGSGKEAIPLSTYTPKTMFTLHGKPLLQYVLDGLIKTGINELVVVVGHLQKKIRPLLQEFRQQGCAITIVDQGEREGIEGAIMASSPYFSDNDAFLLAYGDILTPARFYNHLRDSYVRTAADGAIAVTLVGKSAEFGIVGTDDRGFITELLPETPVENANIPYIFAGAAILPNEFFEILKQTKRLTRALTQLLGEQRRFCASIWQDEWIDVGYAWDLLAANRDVFQPLEYARIHKTAKIAPSAHISGLVLIEENVVIDTNAKIVGPCFIGKNSYIGTNSLIRDFACIEKDCVIGFSTEIKNSVIQQGTKIGRLSYVGDSVVGEHTTLGTGVTTMNFLDDIGKVTKVIKGRTYTKLGAVIGPKSRIGSNTVLLPTVQIEANQIISPGSVISPNRSSVE